MPRKAVRLPAALAAFAVAFALLPAVSSPAQDREVLPLSQPAQTAPDGRPLPPLVTFTPSNSGWSANFSFADPVVEIQWGASAEGPFESTGFARAYDPRTRRPMANTSVEIESKAGTLYVRFAGLDGRWSEPFAVSFDPEEEIRRFHREMLNASTQGWIAFRHDVPNIIYYTHVSGYRCAIAEFRIGIDKPVPDQTVTLPPCGSRADADTHIWIDPSVRFVSAQLIYYDGTASKVKVFTRGATDE
jgi:hypothetical protein